MGKGESLTAGWVGLFSSFLFGFWVVFFGGRYLDLKLLYIDSVIDTSTVQLELWFGSL